MAKGLISLDFIEDDIIDVSLRYQTDDCKGYDLLQPARPETPEFVVIHKAQSEDEANVTLGSPNGYFTHKCCPALTDLEINPKTGRMRRFVKRGSNIAGWANGRISGPYGDALKYIQWKQANGGWNPNFANILGEACEILGFFPSYPVTQDTPVERVAVLRLARWIASRAHDYGIFWEDFPIVKAQGGRSYVTWHREWTLGTGKTCPGPLVMALTSEIIEIARAIMKEAQVGTQIPEQPSYAPVALQPWWGEQLELARPNDMSHEGITYYVLQRAFRLIKDDTQRYSKPEIGAEISGPEVTKGTKVYIERQANIAGRIWLQEEAGHYLLASGFTPKVPTIAPREAA